MSRAIITIRNQADRDRAKHWIDVAPLEMRVEFKAAKRTLPQNDRLWAMLTDVAGALDWHGVKLNTEEWKWLFLDALKREVRVIPNLEGNGFVNIGRSSSDLSKEEFSDLLELIAEFGARHAVTFHDEELEDSHSSGAPTIARDLTDAPAALVQPPSGAAGANPIEEASLLSDDWRDVYINAMSGVRDRPASLKNRNSEAWQMIGGEPSDSEKAWMRKIWNLVFARDTGKLGPGEFETELAKLRTMPLAAVKEAA